MQLLRTILIIIIAYYLFRLIARYVLPLLARYFIRKSMNAHANQAASARKKPGEMNIDFAPDKKQPLDDIGEYVEYEEIEEDKTEQS